MKKIKMQIISLGLALIIGFSAPQPAFAKLLPNPMPGAEEQTTASEPEQPAGSAEIAATLSGEVKQISLDEAMELALTNSKDVLEAKNSLDDAQIDYDRAHEQSRNLRKMLGNPEDRQLNVKPINLGSVTVSPYQAIVLAPQLYKEQVNIYTNAYELQQSAAKLKVIQNYYTVLCDGRAENAAMYAYTKAQNQLKSVSSRFEQGMATKVEKLQAETQVNAARASLDAARATTVQDKRSLSILIGQDVETNWSPTTQLSYSPLLIEDVDAKVKEMVEAAPSVKIAAATFAIAGLQHDYEMSYNSDYTYDGKIAEIAYDTAKIQYENTVRQTTANAKSMLEKLSLAHSQYQIYEESQKLLEEVYRLTQLQYDNGLNTQNDVQAAAAEIVSNEAKRLSALLQYNIARTAIEQGIIQ